MCFFYVRTTLTGMWGNFLSHLTFINQTRWSYIKAINATVCVARTKLDFVWASNLLQWALLMQAFGQFTLTTVLSQTHIIRNSQEKSLILVKRMFHLSARHFL